MSLSNIKVNNSTVTGVDNEPTAGSDNLVKSGGIYKEASRTFGYINSKVHVSKNDNDKRVYCSFKAGTKVKIIISNYGWIGTTDRNINIIYYSNGWKYLYIYYGSAPNATVYGVFEGDTDFIEIKVGYAGETTDIYADVTILYNSGLIEFADTTPTVSKGNQMHFAIQKNDGTEDNPNNRSIAEMVINAATTEKAGLMNAADKNNINRLSMGAPAYAFSGHLSSSENIQYISGPFKAGCLIALRVSDYTFNATNAATDKMVLLNAGSQTVLINRVLNENTVVFGTLSVDCDRLSVQLNQTRNITNIEADVVAAIGTAEVAALISDSSYRLKNTILSLDNKTSDNFYTTVHLVREYGKELCKDSKIIYADFKQGTSLKFKLLEYVKVTGTGGGGDSNIKITVHFTDDTFANAHVYYSLDTKEYEYVLPKDADNIDINIGYQPHTDNVYSSIIVYYGEWVDVLTRINSLENTLTSITPILGSEKKTFIEQNGTISEWFYASVIWVGFNKPFEKKSLLKTLQIKYWNVNFPIGTVTKLVVGTIDQRNWLLVDKEYDVSMSNVDAAGNVTFDLKNIQVNPGQVVFLKSIPLSTASASVNFGYSNEAYDANLQVAYTTNLNNALTYSTSWGMSIYKLDVVEFDSIFVTTDDTEVINDNIRSIQRETDKINSYIDYVTGIPYKLKIINGVVVPQSMNFQRILIISHSYAIYSNSPAADWYLPNNQGRAMAPSVYDNEWAAFLAEKYGATVTKKGGVDFERACDPDFDFATNWNIQDNYDAICVYLNENVPAYYPEMQQAWENMLRYLKSAAPHAEIYCTAGWGGGNKSTAIAAACASVPNINYVNLIGLDANGNCSWNQGDYYIGRGDKYLPMGAPAGHPSDIGHLKIANRFIEVMGKEPFDNKTRFITLSQVSGGVISTRSDEQVIGAVVSIKCIADNGKYISGMTVIDGNGNNIEVTLRVNGLDVNNPNIYYTFIMPDSDVTITPIWSDTKGYTTYTTIVSDISGGTIKNLNAICLSGTRCYFYVKPSSGHSLSSISASAGGSTFTLTPDGENCYYFDMPTDNVVISPIWN